MTSIQKKILFTGVVVVAAVGYLGFAGVKKGWVYYLPVDQFVASADYHDQRVKLCGKVADQGLVCNRAALNASFTLMGQSRHLPVEYRGSIPDMFKPNCEVVVEGKLSADGVFRADMLMTKCASKYETRPANHPPVASGGAAHPQTTVE